MHCPHLGSTVRLNSLSYLAYPVLTGAVTKKNKQLQRIYGISFPKKKMLEEHLLFLEEAKKRDHRKLGKHARSFSIHEDAGAGLVYWHPKGARCKKRN